MCQDIFDPVVKRFLEQFTKSIRKCQFCFRFQLLHPWFIQNNVINTELMKLFFSGNLVFLDNESGFGHSYRIMPQYQHLHLRALQSICFLRKSTFEKLRQLSQQSELEVKSQLQQHLHLHLLPPLSKAQLSILKTRIELANRHFSNNRKISWT